MKFKFRALVAAIDVLLLSTLAFATPIPGTPVASTIVPTDTADTYAVTDPQYGKGGLRTVATTTDRNAITTPRLQEGMLVYVTADQNTYKLLPGFSTPPQNSDWVIVSSSSGDVIGSGIANYLAIWSATNTLTSDDGLSFDTGNILHPVNEGPGIDGEDFTVQSGRGGNSAGDSSGDLFLKTPDVSEGVPGRVIITTGSIGTGSYGGGDIIGVTANGAFGTNQNSGDIGFATGDAYNSVTGNWSRVTGNSTLDEAGTIYDQAGTSGGTSQGGSLDRQAGNGGNSGGGGAGGDILDAAGDGRGTNSRGGIISHQPGDAGGSGAAGYIDNYKVSRFNGSTSGYFGLQSAATSDNQVYTWPGADGGGGEALVTDGNGVLSWTAVGGAPRLAAGDVQNCEFHAGSGQFQITGNDTSSLSSGTPCYIGVRTPTDGEVALYTKTSSTSINDTFMNSNLFGIDGSGTNWSNAMPIFFGVVNNGTDSYFTVSRKPYIVTGSSTNDICQINDSDCDSENDIQILTTGLSLGSWTSMPVTQVGWLTATWASSGGGTWTLEDSIYTGFNKNWLVQKFSFPQGQMGGSTSGSHMINNGGSAPNFSTDNYTYGWESPDSFWFVWEANGDSGGNDGSGGVQARVSLPYTTLLPELLPARFKSPVQGTMASALGQVSAGNSYFIVNFPTQSAGVLGNTETNLLNSDFTNGDRNFNVSGVIQAISNP